MEKSFYAEPSASSVCFSIPVFYTYIFQFYAENIYFTWTMLIKLKLRNCFKAHNKYFMIFHENIKNFYLL